MIPSSLLTQLKDLRVRVQVSQENEGQLDIDAPKGILTPELINQIRASKDEIIQSLYRGTDIISPENSQDQDFHGGNVSVPEEIDHSDFTPDVPLVLEQDLVSCSLDPTWTEGVELIQGVIDRVTKSCPQDWKLGHDSTPWAEIRGRIDSAYKSQDLIALWKALGEYEGAAERSFLDWRIQFLQEVPAPPPDPSIPPTKPCCWCQGTRHWKHAHHGHWVCARCHPPSNQDNVGEEISVEQDQEPDEWDEETGELVAWFLEKGQHKLPSEPFSITSWYRVTDPGKFKESLLHDLSCGPKGPRSKYGALRDDLGRIRDLLEKENNNEL